MTISQHSVAFITLGCAKNEVDTDKMKARLNAAGFDLVDSPEEAALTVVNTCSFLASAVEEGLDTIFDVLALRGYSTGESKVLVAGCMPARYGEDLAAALTEVAGFVSAADEADIVARVAAVIGMPEPPLASLGAGYEAPSRYAAGTFAYVKISDGCNRFCTYCMIPYIRGRYHSFELGAILDEVELLVDADVHEIVFIGQDTGLWGTDFEEPSCTAELLREAATRFPNTWFRIMYTQPEGISDELLEVMATTPNVCSYLDIPMQHANAEVLRRMNRRGSSAELLALVERIRAAVPDITIRTTLMAGFPGETDEQFEEMLDFVADAQIDCAGCFTYSPEEGSKAAEFAGQIDDEVKLERTQQLLDACDAVGFARTQHFVGQELEVIIEAFEDTGDMVEAVARSQAQAPDVDGLVHIPALTPENCSVGDVVRVRCYDTFCYELEAEPL